jgi:DNA-binding CsgD family transcriptional regulator
MTADLGFLRVVYPMAPSVAWVSSLLGQRWTEHAAGFLGKVPQKDRAFLLSRPDFLGIIAGDPSGHGCVFFARDVRASRLPAQAAAMWRRVAAHLATGYRLVRRRAREPDAILHPGGALLHKEKSVRDDETDALRAAMRDIDRARGRLRRVDPDRALELWKGLVAGRWSLVDHFDHDGRRFVMAKRNTIKPKRWPALSEREAQIVACVSEGQSFKLVAYQLGVSTTRIAADLARVQEKVGVRSRLELVAAYKARPWGDGAR